MPHYYSFLSPANINYLITRLRSIYPENVHHDIRENIPYIAHDWYYGEAVNIEEQFVGGTNALNNAFMNYLVATRRFMPALPDMLPSYSTEIMDPFVPNQPFQNVSNDIIYDSQVNDFNVRDNPVFSQINKRLNESDIGGVPVKYNMLETTLSELATEISRNQVRKGKAQPLTWGVKRQCNDNFTSCEHPALPRKKFTLPRDYYSSAPQSEYWMGLNPCNSQMKKYTEWSATGRAGRHPTDSDDLSNPRISEMLIQNCYKYPNYAYYRKDIIPAVKNYNDARMYNQQSQYLQRFSTTHSGTPYQNFSH